MTDRDIDLNKLKGVLDRCGVVVTERRPSKSLCSRLILTTSMHCLKANSGPKILLKTFLGCCSLFLRHLLLIHQLQFVRAFWTRVVFDSH